MRTPDYKREARRQSHEAQRLLAAKTNRTIGLVLTVKQVRALAKQKRDQVVAAGVRDAGLRRREVS